MAAELTDPKESTMSSEASNDIGKDTPLSDASHK
jgi:hypothetical protein